MLDEEDFEEDEDEDEDEDERECDRCGRITDAGVFPDWINGVCEDCDPSILDAPENNPDA
jgi:hypothetical protein